MSRSRDVHQIEFRWQPRKDLCPVARSFPSAETADAWFGRLAGLIRPATPRPDLGVPDCSIVYQDYPDGSAALVWREYAADAIALDGGDSEARRPLVARALIADSALLNLEVALRLCWPYLLTRIAPRPGQVEVGASLPPIGAEELTGLARDDLDSRASQSAGLAMLVAASLRDPGSPLSVLLPAAEMTVPLDTSPQLLLLWGLWRTTAPLLAVPDGAELPGRSWSFSTYEPPLGGTATHGLADIVFRSLEQHRQPQSVREETTVALRSAPSRSDHYDDAAEVIATAYRALPSDEFDRRLGLLVSSHPRAESRVAAVLADARRFAAPVPAAGRQPSAAPRQPQPLAAVPQPPVSLLPSQAPPPQFDSRAPVGGAAGPRKDLARDPAHGPDLLGISTRPGPVGQPRQPEQPGSLPRLLDRLSAGPDQPGFDGARQALLRPSGHPSPEERAAARGQMPGQDWYLPALGRAGLEQAAVGETLAAVFALAVIPDLADPAVGAQVNQWADHAPPDVIRALCGAAGQAGGEAAVHLDRALQSALHRRWLRDHGIRHRPPARRAAAVSHPAIRPVPWWQILARVPRSEVIGSILAWLCLLLILVLAVARL